jgi:hypothetical protein
MFVQHVSTQLSHPQVTHCYKEFLLHCFHEYFTPPFAFSASFCNVYYLCYSSSTILSYHYVTDAVYLRVVGVVRSIRCVLY